MNVVPDVLETVWPGGIVVNFDTLRQFLFQSATEILAKHKGECRKEELHNKQEDNKAKILKQTNWLDYNYKNHIFGIALHTVYIYIYIYIYIYKLSI